MILSRPDILSAIKEKRLRFSPAVGENRVQQVSVDLFLGRRFTQFKPTPGYITAVQLDPSIWGSPDIWQHEERDNFLLQSGGFVLAQTLESVCMPNDLAGFIEGRSSFGRLGVSIHVMAPKIDPGFEGTITLEITNHGTLPITLRAGVDQPAQLILFRVSRPLSEKDLYGSGEGDVFQYQTEPIPRSTPARAGSVRAVEPPRPRNRRG